MELVSENPQTPDEVEELLLEGLELLLGLPDRERGHLAHGRGLRMTGWPDVLREQRAGDYPGDAAPRRRIGVKEVATIERTWTGERAAALAVPEDRRKLVGTVLMLKLRPGPGGFAWERVWEALGAQHCGPSLNSARMRYERALSAVCRSVGVKVMSAAERAREGLVG